MSHQQYLFFPVNNRAFCATPAAGRNCHSFIGCLNSQWILRALLLFLLAISFRNPASLHAQVYFQSGMLTADQGLYDNRTLNVQFDANGFLWIGSKNGLVRYDGSRLKRFNLTDLYNKSSAEAYQVATWESKLMVMEFAQGYMFAIDENSQVRPTLLNRTRRDIYSDEVHNTFESYTALAATDSLRDKAWHGNLFFTGKQEGYLFDGHIPTVKSNADVRRLYYFNNGIVRPCEGVQLKAGITGTKNFLNIAQVNGALVLQDLPGRLLVVRNGAAAALTKGPLYNLYRQLTVPEQAGFFIRQRGKDILIKCGSRLYQLLPGQPEEAELKLLANVPERLLFSDFAISKDKSVLAISTGNMGLLLFQQGLAASYFPAVDSAAINQEETPDTFSWRRTPAAFPQFASSRVFTATGAYTYLPGNGRNKRAWTVSKDESIFRTPMGFILESQPTGASSILTVRDSLFRPLASFPMPWLYLNGFSCRNDSAWLIYTSGKIVLFRLSREKGIQRLRQYDPPVSSGEYYQYGKIALYQEDSLMVGFGDQLGMLNVADGSYRVIRKDSAYLQVKIVYADQQHNVWIATNGQGWFRYNSHSGLEAMPLDREKYLRNILSFAEDAGGRLWAGTPKGMFCLPVNLPGVKSGEYHPFFYRFFDMRDGFPALPVVPFIPEGALIETGQVLPVFSKNALLAFRPDLVPVDTSAVRVFIEEARVDNKSTAVTERITMPQGAEMISYQFVIPYFGNPYNLQVQYKLSGGKDEWIEMPADRLLHFNRLTPGEYTLTVRVLNGAGNGSYSYHRFYFRLLPYWYQTRLFFAGLLLLAVVLTALFFRYRNQEARRQQRHLEREIEKRTEALRQSEEKIRLNSKFKAQVTSLVLHDVRSPLFYLTRITGTIYRTSAGEVSDFVRDQLRELHLSVKEVSEYAQNLFAWVSSQQDDFVMKLAQVRIFDLFEEVCGNYHLLAEQQGNTIGHRTDEQLVVETQPDLLQIVLRNLVDNAIKNTRGGRIMLSAEQQGNNLRLLVWDTGKGMTPEKINQLLNPDDYSSENIKSGMGYRYIRDLLRKLNATLQIQSEPDAGTAITILLPIKPV